MANEREPIAKRIDTGLVEYVCPHCGWYDFTGVFREFLPLIDHLIQDLCLMHSKNVIGKVVPLPDGRVWFQRNGSNELIIDLPEYSPESPVWKKFLKRGEKLLPQAKLFLPDIADWIEKPLLGLEELDGLRQSDILTAESLVSFVQRLSDDFQDQRNYLENHRNVLLEAGTDPKWTGKKGKQASFIARSVAGARWGLATSSSREMIRVAKRSERKAAFKELKITIERFWWLPEA